jgi:hypothetical protein
MSSDTNLVNWITKLVVIILGVILIAVVAVMLVGLFDSKVDNKEIFAVIGPAFSTIVGAFVGLIGGLKLGKSNDE